MPGPELGDYTGLPLTDGARRYAESWDPARITMPEEQCRVHVSPYIYRGPTNIAIWDERAPGTRELIAIKHRISTFDQERTIYMDGRPHPPAYAPHTWMGFSTGVWQGNMLVVTTTHIKKGWLRRNGVPESDLATLTEYFVRTGDVLTRISAIADPVYLTEPLVKSEEFVLNTQGVPHRSWLYKCKPVVEVVRPEGAVPHYLPGKNPYLQEFRKRYGFTETVTRGGAVQTYPRGFGATGDRRADEAERPRARGAEGRRGEGAARAGAGLHARLDRGQHGGAGRRRGRAARGHAAGGAVAGGAGRDPHDFGQADPLHRQHAGRRGPHRRQRGAGQGRVRRAPIACRSAAVLAATRAVPPASWRTRTCSTG